MITFGRPGLQVSCGPSGRVQGPFSGNRRVVCQTCAASPCLGAVSVRGGWVNVHFAFFVGAQVASGRGPDRHRGTACRRDRLLPSDPLLGRRRYRGLLTRKSPLLWILALLTMVHSEHIRQRPNDSPGQPTVVAGNTGAEATLASGRPAREDLGLCSSPLASLPRADLGIDVVVEATGRFRTRDTAAAHLSAGASRVVVSTPCKEADATIVLGVNDAEFDPRRNWIVSNASCTTNCLAPMVKGAG